MYTARLVIPTDTVDEYGHVNYKNFPRLFEPAQDDVIYRKIFGFAAIEKHWGLRSFVKRLSVTYEGQLLAGEQATITTDLTLGNTSVTFAQKMVTKRGPVASLELVVVLVTADGRPCPIPPDLRELLK